MPQYSITPGGVEAEGAHLVVPLDAVDGQLTIRINGCDIVANAGDMVLIPAGSSIVFSALDHARFVYVTYPANWSEQAEGGCRAAFPLLQNRSTLHR